MPTFNVSTTISSNLIYPITGDPTATTLNFDTVVVTPLVIPGAGGILLPGAETLGGNATIKPGGTETWSKLVITVQANPSAALVYHADPKAFTELQSQLPAPNAGSSTGPGVSTTSPPVASTTVAPGSSIAAVSTTSAVPKTPSATTTAASARPHNQDTGLGAGPVAGIAIGVFLIGALTAGLVLWFCWRRKRTSKSQYSGANTYAMASQEKGFSSNTVPLDGVGHTVAGLGEGLPQPLEDKAISGDISKISNAIKNHVQSYYHTSRISPSLIDYDDLHALGPNLPITVGTLTTLMGNTATREIALRFIIAWVVVSRLQPSMDLSKSLLPSEVAQCYKSILTGDRGFQAQASLMARWRVMTAELIQSNYVRSPFTSSDSRNASIQSTFTVLNSVLQPYADSRMNNEERKRNLEELLKRSALFAFTLFSQPSAWEFEWQEVQGVTSGELCIFPALVQVADETGQSVNPPRPFSEAVVRRLDG